uniref:Uncharacterized mitochondrial protein AtMg00810-like n=1 Tax=Nicotiana tabacum TaxID=4097 RepID=A0A1S3YH48_TOBAC|nr:PREDICTED: uncharacterized mitochondrial protein AtMg00810-like [Nicotiana tabacum]
MNDYSLLYKRNGESSVYVAVYVDDVLLTGTDQHAIAQFKAFLHEQFKIKDPGQLHYFLGLKVMYKDDGAKKVCAGLVERIQLLGSQFLFLTLRSHYKAKSQGSVQHLSQFMQEPREPHLNAAFHLLRYLKNDPTQGIFMLKDADHTVRAYCDSDWAACPDSRRSITVYLVLLGNSPINWKYKK